MTTNHQPTEDSSGVRRSAYWQCMGGGVMKWFKRRPRHTHEWAYVGYGGAGWSLIRCASCGEKEISA